MNKTKKENPYFFIFVGLTFEFLTSRTGKNQQLDPRFFHPPAGPDPALCRAELRPLLSRRRHRRGHGGAGRARPQRVRPRAGRAQQGDHAEELQGNRKAAYLVVVVVVVVVVVAFAAAAAFLV